MRKYLQTGFTLVELLIVMAILAVLAVGVLIGLNPVEQINRSKDTATQDVITQISQAFERYNAAQIGYPWERLSTTLPINMAAALTGSSTSITALTSTNELKSPILTSAELTRIYLGVAASAPQFYTLCYVPTSKAYQWSDGLETRNNWQYMNLDTNSMPVDCTGTGTGATCTSASYLCLSNQ